MPREPAAEKTQRAPDMSKVRDGPKTMRLLVGEALVNAAHARPDDHYVLSVARRIEHSLLKLSKHGQQSRWRCPSSGCFERIGTPSSQIDRPILAPKGPHNGGV